MIRKLALTIASLALMATSVVAQPNTAVVQQQAPYWKTMTAVEQMNVRADAYKVGVAYNFCRDYIEPDDEISRFVIWIIAQAEGLSLQDAGIKMDRVANVVWQKTAVEDRVGACFSAAAAVNEWRTVVYK